MGISLGLVGLGQFGSGFADLFKSHPLVDRVGLCDLEPERIKKFSEDPFFQDKLDKKDIYHSLDDILASDLDAIVLITQPWLHAPQAVAAMEHGKHVYSAVPIISVPDDNEILDWCDKIINTALSTGQHYMLGETSYYRPNAMFCRRMAAEGKFGNFVYGEGEYMHDVDGHCNLREVKKHRSTGKAGKEGQAILQKYLDQGHQGGPMHYPTHSTCGPVSTMQTYAKKVTAYGYKNQNNDDFFKDSAFSNEVAFFTMANGSTVRIAEMRECAGHTGDDGETFRLMGTSGTYSDGKWHYNGRTTPDSAQKPTCDVLKVEDMRDPLPADVEEAFKAAMNKNVNPNDLQNMDFVPHGHGGSHPYLVHEFVDAVANDRVPAINAWEASRYMAMGVAAHKSALADGERLDVVDWGDAPTTAASASAESTNA